MIENEAWLCTATLEPATHAPETCNRNCYQKLVRKIWRKVHHSFLHQNNSPANHVARFVSRARQFLWWNRAVFYSVPETGTRKKLVPDWLTHVQVSGTRRLVPVSRVCVASLRHIKDAIFLQVSGSLRSGNTVRERDRVGSEVMWWAGRGVAVRVSRRWLFRRRHKMPRGSRRERRRHQVLRQSGRQGCLYRHGLRSVPRQRSTRTCPRFQTLAHHTTQTLTLNIILSL